MRSGKMSSCGLNCSGMGGLPLELRCDVPALLPEIGHFLHAFEVSDFPAGFGAISGSVHPFEMTTVQRHLSPSAVPFAATRDLIELYQDGERFWCSATAKTTQVRTT